MTNSSVCVLCSIIFFLFSCNAGMTDLRQIERMNKLTFDISQIDDQGLVGPADGKTTLAYEFCIPQDAIHVAQIRTIDPTLKISRSKGRIGCTQHEYLVLGETNENYRTVLKKLVRLDYIKQIDRTWFE